MVHEGMHQTYFVFLFSRRNSFNGYGELSIPVLDSSKDCIPTIRGDLHVVFEIEKAFWVGLFLKF